MPQADQAYTTTYNVVPITTARRFAAPVIKPPSPEAQPISQTVEMAMLFGLYSALSVGNERDRALFGLIGWELDRALARNPHDASLATAVDLHASIQEVNDGR